MGLIEEVRGVLQQSASTDTWFELCDLCTLDAPDALYEQLEAYTHDHIKRWPESVLRPSSSQWVGREMHAWLWKSANCASTSTLDLTPDQKRLYAQHGLKLLPYTPMRPGERRWLIAQLLKAPDVERGPARDPDEGTSESLDDAVDVLRRHYPALGAMHQPRQHRSLFLDMIESAYEQCVQLSELAQARGFTETQSHDLAFGRTRIIWLRSSHHAMDPSSFANVLELIGQFTHTRELDLGGTVIDAIPESWASLRKLRSIDLSFSGVDVFPEALMVPTLCTVTHGPHTLISEQSRRQTRRRVPYVKFVQAAP